MQADIKWLDSPEIFRVNQIPAHSDHHFYEDREAYETGKNRLVQSLNGTWRFCYSPDVKKRPKEFFRETFDYSDFDSMEVPSHIQLSGYDRIHYINTMYPWEGHVYRRPVHNNAAENSFSEAEDNAVGSYILHFDLAEGLRKKRVFIRFEGVEMAMYLWLNGHFIGYAEDSFTPSEFDLSSFIREQDNLLAVRVFKRSTAAFLEDQDFFRFFGIFRNVTLYAKPAIHVEDVWAKPVLFSDNRSGGLALDLTLSGEEVLSSTLGSVQITLTDPNGEVCLFKTMPLAEKLSLPQQPLKELKAWDNHNPYLYELTVTIRDAKQKVIEFVPVKIGFRRIEIQDRVMLLNGKRLILCGVNRHEWSAKRGRSITRDDMEFDMQVLLKNNINAVRTCHYPNQIPWYELCDQHGIYVMSETNLESHGSWQKMGVVEPSWNVPGDSPQWTKAVLDRARTHFETFKNHPSILFWSLGNESYAGEAIAKMNEYFKEQDKSRLVHYEGVFHNRAYETRISDLESRMYATPSEIREYLLNCPQKPFILCEYMHGMGNSLGGMDSYMELLCQFDMYQGGFLWDYMDQALFVTDEVTNKQVLRYGGDFDDRPSDYEFSGNGILFADRSEKPALQEVRYFYEICQK